jgi:hypothetical protein
MGSAELAVTVAYATAARQVVLPVRVVAGAAVHEAIAASGILEEFPEIELARQAVGIFGERAALTDPVRDGDRIEIYRPLRADPKEARRARASGRHGAPRRPSR